MAKKCFFTAGKKLLVYVTEKQRLTDTVLKRIFTEICRLDNGEKPVSDDMIDTCWSRIQHNEKSLKDFRSYISKGSIAKCGEKGYEYWEIKNTSVNLHYPVNDANIIIFED